MAPLYYLVADWDSWGGRARAQGQLPPAAAHETYEGDIVSHATQHLCCQCITVILKS